MGGRGQHALGSAQQYLWRCSHLSRRRGLHGPFHGRLSTGMSLFLLRLSPWGLALDMLNLSSTMHSTFHFQYFTVMLFTVDSRQVDRLRTYIHTVLFLFFNFL